jgi:thiol-disulfide isomerase/thioredoxin
MLILRRLISKGSRSLGVMLGTLRRGSGHAQGAREGDADDRAAVRSRPRSFLFLLPVAFTLALAASEPQAQTLKPWTGGATPVLALSDLDGRPHRLEDYRGKVVLVNFWATWCEPCRDEMPSLQKLRAGLEGRPFVVLAVNLAESESRVRRFLEHTPIACPVLLDREGGVAKAWGARILPASFVIGPDGAIRYWALGELDWSDERIRRSVLALMPAAATPPRAGLSASFR